MTVICRSLSLSCTAEGLTRKAATEYPDPVRVFLPFELPDVFI
jgi:hypothetical protein